MKAAESIDDVTTALSAQASLEREKALRRSAPALSPSDDSEFADPEADDDQTTKKRTSTTSWMTKTRSSARAARSKRKRTT